MRRAGRVDIIQKETVKALRDIGACVQILAAVGQGVPDLLVGYRGKNLLLELKTGREPLTKDEQDWHDTWGGQVAVARSSTEAQLIVISAGYEGALLPEGQVTCSIP